MGGDVVRFHDPTYSARRRASAAQRRGDDIEDKYIRGTRKTNMINCPLCGSVMYPWKEDELGDIIMACPIPYCLKSAEMAGSINVELAKLMKQQQMSTRYYKNYMGGYR